MMGSEKLYKGTSQAAWGYVLLLVNFNLGTVSVTPNFVGWALLFSAIGKLQEERRELGLLRPLTTLLGLYALGEWLLNLVGIQLDGLFLPLDLVTGILALYFHFQFLTDMAALASRFSPPEEDLPSALLRWRNVSIFLHTASLVLTILVQSLGWSEDSTPLLAVALLLSLMALVLICGLLSALFRLRKCFEGIDPPPPAEELP